MPAACYTNELTLRAKGVALVKGYALAKVFEVEGSKGQLFY